MASARGAAVTVLGWLLLIFLGGLFDIWWEDRPYRQRLKAQRRRERMTEQERWEELFPHR